MDDGGIDDRAPGQLQTMLFQMLMHLLEQSRSQLVLLQQVTELAERGLVRHGPRPGSMPANRRIASESYSASSAPGSDR